MKRIAFAILFTLVVSTAVFAASPFSDLKPSHWAFDAIERLAAKGYVDGYPDSTFRGDKSITRYELAQITSRLIEKMKAGAPDEDLRTLERLTIEFSDELALLGVKVSAMGEQIGAIRDQVASLKREGPGKVSLSGDMLVNLSIFDRKLDTRGDDDWFNFARIGLNFFVNVDEDVSAFVRFMSDKIEIDNLGISDTILDEVYVDVKNFFRLGDLRVGRQWMSLGHSLVLGDKVDGIRFSKVMDQVAVTMFAFSTRAANAANDQFAGDRSGTGTFYMFADTGLNATSTANPVGGGNDYTNAVAAYAVNDRITLYNTPYAFPAPTDGFIGSTFATVRTDTWVEHAGIVINGGYGTDLAPVDANLTSGYIKTPLSRPFTAFAINGFTANLDKDGKVLQNVAGLTRDWDVKSASGLDSWGFNVSVDFGGHALAGYFLQRNFDRFDPFTGLGDPWAAMVDYDSDGIIDTDHTGRDLSPAADPSYWGITLDGNILRNLDYFFEFVGFDPDISNIGVDPLSGRAVNAAGAWNGGNLDSGKAWLLGIDWDMTDDLNLIVQYGVGDEEFIPASVYKTEYFNGMSGRWNADLSGLSTNGDARMGEASGALTGVKDLLIKFSAEFNEKTSGFIKYEIVKDNDTSTARLVAGDPMVTGHGRQDFRLLTLRFKHIYKPNTVLGLRYDLMKYEESGVDTAHVTGVEGYLTDDVNGGGWQRVGADIQVKF